MKTVVHIVLLLLNEYNVYIVLMVHIHSSEEEKNYWKIKFNCTLHDAS